MFFKKKNKKNDNKQELNKKSGILILGAGCAKCEDLEDNTKSALEKLNIDEEPGHISDYAEMASFGIMSTPALVVDGKVLSVGRVLSEEEIIDLLKKNWSKLK